MMRLVLHHDVALSLVRTTIDLDDAATAAVERLRRERGLGLSAAVNELIRQGLLHTPPRPTFRQETHPLGITIDVTNVAEALEVLEGPTAR